MPLGQLLAECRDPSALTDQQLRDLPNIGERTVEAARRMEHWIRSTTLSHKGLGSFCSASVRLFRFGGKSAGTATLYRDDSGDVFAMTARHLVEELLDGDSDSLVVKHDNLWNKVKYAQAWTSNMLHDISILALDPTTLPGCDVDELSLLDSGLEGSCELGESVWYAGYPYQWDSGTLTRGMSTPFVRAAVVAGFDGQDTPGTMYMDGLVNDGFSGGPVLCRRDGELRQCGVLSGATLVCDDELGSDEDANLARASLLSCVLNESWSFSSPFPPQA